MKPTTLAVIGSCALGTVVALVVTTYRLSRDLGELRKQLEALGHRREPLRVLPGRYDLDHPSLRNHPSTRSPDGA